VDFRSLQSLALRVGEARTLDDVFTGIVDGLAAQNGVALARVWLVLPGDICRSCVMRQECPDQRRCLHLVASAGTSVGSAEDWSWLDGHFRRIPLGVRKVGQVGASGEAVLISNNLTESHWIARPDWARREGIVSFAGQPLISRGDTLGVLAVFSRAEITQGESDWLRIFADHAAIAIANARAFDEVARLRRRLELDIEDLKRTEYVLRGHARLLDLTHDTIFVRDMSDAITYWNRGAETLYGWSRDEAIGKISHQLTQTIFPTPLDEINEELLRTGRWEGELVHTKRDGTQVVVASRWSLQRDELGRPAAILETNNDVTERKRAEAELGESEGRYRHIFQSAGVSIWEEDFSEVKAAIDDLKSQGLTDFSDYLAAHPDFVSHAISLVKIIDVNDTTLTLLGARSKNDLLVSLDRIFLPETREAFAGELIAIAEGHTRFEAETVLQTLDGKRLFVLFNIVFPADSATLGSVLVSMIDITERRRLDNELRRSQAYLIAAQELGHTGSWSRLVTGEAYWSEETYRIFGLDPRSPAPNRQQLLQICHPDDRDQFDQALEAANREARSFEIDFRIIWPDSTIRYVHAKSQPVLDDAGAVVEVTGVVMDVTDRKRAERALRRARERALETRFAAVLEERTRLARDIHDTLLQGFTGVALKLVAAISRVTEPAESVVALRDLVGLAQQTLTDARRAVWDLRSPALQAGDFPAALRAAAEDCVRGTRLELEYAVGGPPRPVDPDVEAVVLRVAQEAITNVVKHAEAHTVRVRLSFEARRIRLSVIDDGCGFAVEPDFQAYGGHWGLLGMRERASQIHGKLALRSTPGHGTEVVLLVPYVPGHRSSAASAASSSAS
jgi:PAS domain S-box-containing protein